MKPEKLFGAAAAYLSEQGVSVPGEHDTQERSIEFRKRADELVGKFGAICASKQLPNMGFEETYRYAQIDGETKRVVVRGAWLWTPAEANPDLQHLVTPEQAVEKRVVIAVCDIATEQADNSWAVVQRAAACDILTELTTMDRGSEEPVDPDPLRDFQTLERLDWNLPVLADDGIDVISETSFMETVFDARVTERAKEQALHRSALGLDAVLEGMNASLADAEFELAKAA